jgi:serine/threonine-protein kinase
MPLDAGVSELLMEWETRAAAGLPTTPEELCRSRPELLGELRRCIDLLRFVSPLLDLDDATGSAFPTISGFEVLGRLGAGGMGVVYRARDMALKRVVAVKMPYLGLLTGEVARSRFEREARVLAQLRHPHIVPVHAAGLTDGKPYFVMDYLPQGSLAGEAAGLTGQVEVVIGIVEKVARAVDHAHQRGVFHRDLKPSNILLDEGGQPLVADFGVAALRDPGAEEDEYATPPEEETLGAESQPARLTRTGAAVGTPAYMAPEQFAAGCPASRATDVWALGVILYELLTGRLPFAADDPTRPESGIGQAAPPRPSDLQPPSRRDRRLDAIVLRCLAKNPGDRYASAAALADDIARWRDGTRTRKRRRRVTALVLVLAAAAGPAFFLTRPVDEEARHRDRTRPAVSALQRQESVELMPAVGPPASFVVREGKEYARVICSAREEAFSIHAGRIALFSVGGSGKDASTLSFTVGGS